MTENILGKFDPEITAPPGGFARAKNYRPEIDGLRALAILPVVLFHAGLGFPGGYVGVDVFFVISGYLITSLLLKEMESGTFTLKNFWGRRARRIAPAAFVLTLAVLITGYILLLPLDFQALGKSAAAQSLFMGNIYFWRTINYFASTTNSLPLLHTWSLAVEEQFYILFPLFLLLCRRSEFLRRRDVLGVILLSGFALSLALSAWTLNRVGLASLTFYLLPCRAWELLTGSLVAVCPGSWVPSRKLWRELYSWIGVGAILVPVFYYSKETLFPGVAAFPPCLGAALIIFSNSAPVTTGAPLPGLTFCGRILAAKAPVGIGLISYSLYLWHWPVFAFSWYFARQPLDLSYRAAAVASSFLLAILSYRWIETPIRRRQYFATTPAILRFGGFALGSILLLGVTVACMKGLPRRFPSRVDSLAAARLDGHAVTEMRTRDVLLDHLGAFGAPVSRGRPDVFIWGDSQATSALPAFDLYCRRAGISGKIATHSSTSPLLNYYNLDPYSLNREAIPFGNAILDYIRRNGIPNVILCDYWQRDLLKSPAAMEAALVRTIQAFRGINVRVYVMLQVPDQPLDVPRFLALDAFRPQGAIDWRRTILDYKERQAPLYRIAAQYHSPDCIFIDPEKAFEDPAAGRYRVVLDDHPLYYNENHLSTYGATQVLEPYFERTLPPFKRAE